MADPYIHERDLPAADFKVTDMMQSASQVREIPASLSQYGMVRCPIRQTEDFIAEGHAQVSRVQFSYVEVPMKRFIWDILQPSFFHHVDGAMGLCPDCLTLYYYHFNYKTVDHSGGRMVYWQANP